MRYFVGLDLGQKHDFSALAVLDRVETKGEWDPWQMAYRKDITLRLRHLERVPLGTPYPDIVRRVRDVGQSSALGGQYELVVDATGVGAPVVDMLYQARLPCRVSPVTVTGGRAGDPDRRLGPRSQAGPDASAANPAARAPAQDRAQPAVRRGAVERNVGDAGEDDPRGKRNLRRLARRIARRHGLCRRAGVLARPKGLGPRPRRRLLGRAEGEPVGLPHLTPLAPAGQTTGGGSRVHVCHNIHGLPA